MIRFVDLKSYFMMVSLKDMNLSKDYNMTSIGDVLFPYLEHVWMLAYISRSPATEVF